MEKFDIYIIKKNTNKPMVDSICDYGIDDLWNKLGFIGLNLDLGKAVEIKKRLGLEKMVVAISPISYRESKKIAYDEAKKIAEKELNRLKKINNKYGKLINGLESPMWFPFLANDYELQREGYTPGFWGCYIDKISGLEVSTDVIMKYEFL